MRDTSRMKATTEKLALAVNTREAARLLSVSPRTIQNYISAKLLPARKIGRRTIISVRALENFLRTDQPSPVAKPSGASDAR
jgi:excisionase family DNA binding protein